MVEQLPAEQQCCENTDREIWREREGDYYADSIHVTKSGAIGIDCGGLVFVKSVREWHRLANEPRASHCDCPYQTDCIRCSPPTKGAVK